MRKFLRGVGAFLYAWFVQTFIWLDQGVNVIIMPFFTGTIGYADETLSARAWRAKSGNKFWGKLFTPIIDLLFFWQGYPGHCERAFEKERRKLGLPEEYHD